MSFELNNTENNSKLKTQNSKLPSPPWKLTGSAALLLSKSGGVALVHYESSPVGPYDEYARCVLTLRGPRVVEMLVTNVAAQIGGIENWGFPKEIADLSWHKRQNHVEFRKNNEIYRLRACGPRFPLRLKFFCVQTLHQNAHKEDVRVPFLLHGEARFAWRGKQIALLVENFVFVVDAPQPIDTDSH